MTNLPIETQPILIYLFSPSIHFASVFAKASEQDQFIHTQEPCKYKHLH